MPTATRTWHLTGSDSITQQVGGGTAPTYSTDSTANAGALSTTGFGNFAQGTKSQTDALCEAYNGSTGPTFASLFGIASGDSVSQARITGLYDQVTNNTKLTSHQLVVTLIDDAGSTIVTLATINPGTGTGSWADVGAGSNQAMTKSGSDGCRLKFAYTCTTSGGGGTADVDYGVDEVTVEITYTGGGTTYTDTGSGIIEMTGAGSRSRLLPRSTLGVAPLTGGGERILELVRTGSGAAGVDL